MIVAWHNPSVMLHPSVYMSFFHYVVGKLCRVLHKTMVPFTKPFLHAVVNILLSVYSDGDWVKALDKYIPKRKGYIPKGGHCSMSRYM